jgi:hypothetical protein
MCVCVKSVSITLYISSPLPSPAVAVCHEHCAHTLTAHVSVHTHMQHRCIAIVALLCIVCTYYYYASTVLQCIQVCTHGQATAGGKGVGDSPAAASQQLQHAKRACRGATRQVPQTALTHSTSSRWLTGLAGRTAHVKML